MSSLVRFALKTLGQDEQLKGDALVKFQSVYTKSKVYLIFRIGWIVICVLFYLFGIFSDSSKPVGETAKTIKQVLGILVFVYTGALIVLEIFLAVKSGKWASLVSKIPNIQKSEEWLKKLASIKRFRTSSASMALASGISSIVSQYSTVLILVVLCIWLVFLWDIRRQIKRYVDSQSRPIPKRI